MPLRHLVLVELTDETETDDYAKLDAEAAKLLQAIPGVQQYQSGINTNPDPERKLAAATMVFEDREILQSYFQHPNHQKAVEMLRDHWKNFRVLQLEI